MDQAGFLAALPYLLMACIVQSAGFLADLARTRGRLSTTQVKLIKRYDILKRKRCYNQFDESNISFLIRFGNYLLVHLTFAKRYL